MTIKNGFLFSLMILVSNGCSTPIKTQYIDMSEMSMKERMDVARKHGCNLNGIDFKRTEFNIAIGGTVEHAKKKALEEYYLGRERKVPVAAFDVTERAELGTSGVSYEKQIHANTSAWAKGVAVRSCKVKYRSVLDGAFDHAIAVVLLKPGNFGYYEDGVPDQVSTDFLKSFDNGFGITIHHFIKDPYVQRAIRIAREAPTRCFVKEADMFCFSAHRNSLRFRKEVMSGMFLTDNHKRDRHYFSYRLRRGELKIIKVYPSTRDNRVSEERFSTSFLLELERREGKSGEFSEYQRKIERGLSSGNAEAKRYYERGMYRYKHWNRAIGRQRKVLLYRDFKKACDLGMEESCWWANKFE